MSETPTETPVGTATEKSNDDFEPDPPQEGAPTEKTESKTYDAAYVANLRKEAAKYRTEAKAAATELEKARKASLSEAERAVADAEARGRQAAASEYGARFARASFDALAARRNPDVNTDDIVEFMDMGRFLSDDGEVDRKALQAAVDRLVPERPSGPPSQDGGPRATSKATDMNSIIRAQALGGRHP